MAVSGTTPISSPVLQNLSASSTAADKTDAASQQDRFMKLLVAQLNNQDPMNPMDNAQLTSQTAQISTVSGIEKLNSSVLDLAKQFSSMQMLQSASLIGHDVLMAGNRLAVTNGQASGGVDLTSAADKVSVQILSPGGQLLDTLELGSLQAGRQQFSWDASNYTGGGALSFKVTASKAGQAIPATALARDTITSIGTDGSAMSIALQSGATVGYGQIKSVL
jgi:flagellar basal-body rod modification protein FlgD